MNNGHDVPFTRDERDYFATLKPQDEPWQRLKDTRTADSAEWRYRGKLRFNTAEPRTPWWQVAVGWAIIGAIIWIVVRAR